MEDFFNRLRTNGMRFPEEYRRVMHNLFVTAYSFKDEAQLRLITNDFYTYRNLVGEGFKMEVTKIETDNILEFKYMVTFKPSAILAHLSKYD